ncbi:UNVERIFIED_CONTAM: hypothetical protein HHA_242640 [Hammondia hammondi]|eukprot:XP_008884412.1 hypothetical protein HHA_242640 [Hammondia hammondi]
MDPPQCPRLADSQLMPLQDASTSSCHASSLFAPDIVHSSLGGSCSAAAEAAASPLVSASSVLVNGENVVKPTALPSCLAPASFSGSGARQNGVESSSLQSVVSSEGGGSALASAKSLDSPSSNSASLNALHAPSDIPTAGKRRGKSPSRASPPSSSPASGTAHQPLQRELVLMHRMTQEQFQQRLLDVSRYRRTVQVVNFRNTVFPSAYSIALFFSAAEKAPQLTKVLMYYFDSLPPAQFRVFCYGLSRCRHVRHVDANATGAAGLPAWRTLLLLKRLKAFPDIRHVTLSGNELESFRGGGRRCRSPSKTGGDTTRPSSDSEGLDDEERREEESEWARDSDYTLGDEALETVRKPDGRRDKSSDQENDGSSALHGQQATEKKPAGRVPGAGKAEIKKAKAGIGEKGKALQRKAGERPAGEDLELSKAKKFADQAASEERLPASAERREAATSREDDKELETAAKQLLAQVLADVRAGRRAARRRRYFLPLPEKKKEHCSRPDRVDEKRSLSPSLTDEENETRAVYPLRDLMIGGVVCLQIKECALIQQSQLSLWVLNSCHLLRLRQFDLGKSDRSLALVLPDEKDPPTNGELLRRICLMSRQLWTQRKQSSDILTPFHAADDWQEPMLPYFWLYSLLDCMLLYAHNHPSSSAAFPPSALPPDSDKSGDARPSGGDAPVLPFAGAAYASLLNYPQLLRQPLVRVWMPPQEPVQGSGTTLKLPPGSSGFCYALLVGRVGDRCLVRWLTRRQFSDHLEKDQLACRESHAFPFHKEEVSSSSRGTNIPPSLSSASAPSDVSSVLSRFKALTPVPPLCPLCVPPSPSSGSPSSEGFAPGPFVSGASHAVPRGRSSSRLAAAAAVGALHGTTSSLYSGGVENSPQMRQKRELESFFGRFDATIPVPRVEPAAFAWDWIQGSNEETSEKREGDERAGAPEGSIESEEETGRKEQGDAANKHGLTSLKSKDGAKDSLVEGGDRRDMPELAADKEGSENKRDDRKLRTGAKEDRRSGEQGIGVGSWVEVDLGGDEDANKPFVTAIGIVCHVDQAPAGAPPPSVPSWQAPSCAFNPQVGLAVAASRSNCERLTPVARRLLTCRLRVCLLHTKPAQTGVSPQASKSVSRATVPSVGKHVASGGNRGCDAGRFVTVSFNRVRPLQVLMAPKDTWALSAVRKQIAKMKDEAEKLGAEKRFWGFGGALGSCVLLPKEWGVDAAERDFGASRAFPVALSLPPKASTENSEVPSPVPLVLHSKLLPCLETDRVEFVQKAMQHPRQLIVHFGFGLSGPASSPSSGTSRRGQGPSQRGGGTSGTSAGSGGPSETSEEVSPHGGPGVCDKFSTSQTFNLSCGERASSQVGEDRKTPGGGHVGSTGNAGWSAHTKHVSPDSLPGFRCLDYKPFFLPPSTPAALQARLDGRAGASPSYSGQGKAKADVQGTLSSEKTSGEGTDLKTQGQAHEASTAAQAPRPAGAETAGGVGRSAAARRASSPPQCDGFDPENATRQDSLFVACSGSAAEVALQDRKPGSPGFVAGGAGLSQGAPSGSQKKRSTGGALKEAKGGPGSVKTSAAAQGGKGAQSKRARMVYSPTISGKVRSVGSDKSMSPPPFRLDRERSPSPTEGASRGSVRSQQKVFLGTSLSGTLSMQIDSHPVTEGSASPSCSTSAMQKGFKEKTAFPSVPRRPGGWTPGSKERGASGAAPKVLARGPLAALFLDSTAGEGEVTRRTPALLQRRRIADCETPEERKRRKLDEVRKERDAEEAQRLWRLSLPCPVISPREAEGEVCLSNIDLNSREARPTERCARDEVVSQFSAAQVSSQVSPRAIGFGEASTSSRDSSPASSRSCSPPASPLAASSGAYAPFTLHLSRGTSESFTKDRHKSSRVLAENPLLPPARQPLTAGEWELIKNALHFLRGRGVCGLICEAGGSRLSLGSVREETEQYFPLPLIADVWQPDEGSTCNARSSKAHIAGGCTVGGEGISNRHFLGRQEREGSVLPENRNPLNGRCSCGEEVQARSEALPKERSLRPCFWRLNDDSLNQVRCFLEFCVSRRQFRMLQEEHFQSCPAAVERRHSPHQSGQQSPRLSSQDAASLPQKPFSRGSDGDAVPSFNEPCGSRDGNYVVFPPSSAASLSPGDDAHSKVPDSISEGRRRACQESTTCICLDICTCCMTDRASQRPESSDLLGPLLAAVSPPSLASRRDRSKASRFSGERAPPPESAPARAAVMRSSRTATEAGSGVTGQEGGPQGINTAGGDTAGTGSSGVSVGSSTAEGTASSGTGKKRGRGKGPGGSSQGLPWSSDGVGGEYRPENVELYRRYAEAILEQQARRRRRRLKCESRQGSFGWRRDQFLRRLRQENLREDTSQKQPFEGDEEEGETDGVNNLGEAVEDRLYRVTYHLAESGDIWGFNRGRHNQRSVVPGGSVDPTGSRGGIDTSFNHSAGSGVRRPWESAEVGLFHSDDDMSGLDTEKDEEDPTVQRRLRRERRAAASQAAAAAAAENGPPSSGAMGPANSRRSSIPCTQDLSRQSGSSTGVPAKKVPSNNRRSGKSRKASTESPSTAPSPSVSVPAMPSLPEVYASGEQLPAVQLDATMDAEAPSAEEKSSHRPETLPVSFNAHPFESEFGQNLQGRDSQRDGRSPSGALPTINDNAGVPQGVVGRPPETGRPETFSGSAVPESQSRQSDTQVSGGKVPHNKGAPGDNESQDRGCLVLTSPAAEATGGAAQGPRVPREATGSSVQAQVSDGAFLSDDESSMGPGGALAASEGSVGETIDASPPATVDSPSTDGEGRGGSEERRTESPASWQPVDLCGPDPREPFEVGSVSGDQETLSLAQGAEREVLVSNKEESRHFMQSTALSSRREHDECRQVAPKEPSPSACVVPQVRASLLSPCSVGPEGKEGPDWGGHRASSPSRRPELHESQLQGVGSTCSSRSNHGSPRTPDGASGAGPQAHTKAGKAGGVEHASALGSLQSQLQQVQHQQHQLAKYREQFQQHIAQQQLLHLQHLAQHQKLSHRQWVRHAPAYYAVHGFPRHGQVFAAPAAFASGPGASLHYSPVQVLQCVSESAPSFSGTRCIPRPPANAEPLGAAVHAAADPGQLALSVADARAPGLPAVRRIELRPVPAPEGPSPGALGSPARPGGVSATATSLVGEPGVLCSEGDPRSGPENETLPILPVPGRLPAAAMNGTHSHSPGDGERLAEIGYGVEQVIDLTEDE